MTTGENAGDWGTKTNTNLQIVEQIAGGYTAQSIAGSAQTTTLSVSDGSTGAVLAHRIIEFTGTITGNQIVTIPLDVQTFYIVKNNTSGAYTVQFKYVSGSGSSVTWAATDKGTKLIYATADDGTNPNLVDSNIGGVGTYDLDGGELTLDADSDTSITASTDDQIDFEIAGADDFTMTANAFNVLTGSHATFADSANAKFGTGNDMLMYHDGSNSYITNAVGALKIATETSGIALTIGHTTSETTIADNLTVTGDAQGTTITATTAFVPDASDGAALGTSALEFSDLFLADGAVVNFGDDQEVTLTHVEDAGLLLNSDNYLTFRDSALKIHSSADGQLDIDADTEVEITATTVDLNGILDVSGVIVAGGQISAADGTAGAPSISNTGDLNTGLLFSAADTLAFSAGGTSQFTMADGVIAPVTDNDVDLGTTSLEFKNVYVDGTTFTDALGFGTVVMELPVADGSDGQLLKTDGSGNLDWTTVSGTITALNNATANELTTVGSTTTELDAEANLTFTGSALTCIGTVTVGINDTGHDVKYFGATGGSYWLWDEDADGVVQIGTLTVGVDDAGHDVKFFGNAASAYMLWDTSADDLILAGGAGLIVPDGQFTLGSTAVSSTAAEINLIDGGTSRGTTAVASGDGILINDNGTMAMTNVDTVSTYFASHSVGGGNIVTTGALDSGSITSGFGAIDNGTSNIRTATFTAETAFVPDASGGADLGTTALEFNDAFFNDSAVINFGDDQDTTLTHTDGTGLTLNSTNKLCFNDTSQFVQGSSATVLSIGATDEIDLTATAIDINGTCDISGTFSLAGTNITTTAAEINKLDGGTSATGTTIVDADRLILNDNGTIVQVAVTDMKTYIGGGTSWQAVKTANFTAAAGQGVFANTTSSAWTVTLPAGTIGDEISIIDYAGTFDSNNLTVAADGSEKIHGSTDDLTVATERAGFTLVYTDGTQGWLLKDK